MCSRSVKLFVFTSYAMLSRKLLRNTQCTLYLILMIQRQIMSGTRATYRATIISA
jgi:hypothetical protein